MAIYAQDNKCHYPSSKVTMDTVDAQLLRADYLKSPGVFQCPSDRNIGTMAFWYNLPEFDIEPTNQRTKENKRSFAFNVSAWGWENPVDGDESAGGHCGFKTTKQSNRRANESILLVETHARNNVLYHHYHHAYFGPGPWWNEVGISGYNCPPGDGLYANNSTAEYDPYKGKYAHGKGSNFGFADGHAEFIRIKRIDGEYPPFKWYHAGLYKPGSWLLNGSSWRQPTEEIPVAN
jgi:prepilin-type processing-associated H-X9-DG protein